MADSSSPLVTLVGESIPHQDPNNPDLKWSTFVKGAGGLLYGIPHDARYVAKFNPVDKSMEMIGPDLGNEVWMCGVLDNKWCIHCPPHEILNPIDDHDNLNPNDNSRLRMLKINTVDGTVEASGEELQRLGVNDRSWLSGALGPDNCIYYTSAETNHILRCDPDTNILSRIEVPAEHTDHTEHSYFVGTVLGNDDYIYGLPLFHSLRSVSVVKFDPRADDNISCFPEYRENAYRFRTDGVLASDGHIYALNDCGQVLQVNTSTRIISLIGEHIYDHISLENRIDNLWGSPIIGVDNCIYWPPNNAPQVLKFDPTTQQPPSLVGPDNINPIHNDAGDRNGWYGGALADDGIIYCAPYFANQVLAIDPLRELSATISNRIRQYPGELGRLFVQNTDTILVESVFDSAVRKFGLKKALVLLNECLSSNEEWERRGTGNWPLLMMLIASSEKGVGGAPLDAVYHLVRGNAEGLIILLVEKEENNDSDQDHIVHRTKRTKLK